MDRDDLRFRPAVQDDLPAIVAMLADDLLGAQREGFRDPLSEAHHNAFAAIDADAQQELIVAESNGTLVGTMQPSFLRYLTYRGGMRMQIEAVRVAASHRGAGIGEKLFRWAIACAGERGCHLVRLATDKQRPDALRFYERVDFRASHEGMKLHLVDDAS